jgi:hypothetical protein
VSEALGNGRLVRILRTEERIGALLVHSEERVVIMRSLLILGWIERSGVGLLGPIIVYLLLPSSGCRACVEWIRHPAEFHEDASVFFQDFAFDFLVLGVDTHMQFTFLLLILQHVAHVKG